MTRPRVAVGALAVACATLATLAQAGSFSAMPVRLTLAAGVKSTSVTLENKGDEPVQVQSELLAWSQRDGRDVYAPTSEVAVSPPIFTIAPHSSQIVRVGLLRPADPTRELTYRLYLQELPPPAGPPRATVNALLRLSLPLFVLPRASAAPVLSWQAENTPDGSLQLALTNSGTAHVRAIDYRLLLPDGSVLADGQIAAYLLHGQTRSWTLNPSRAWKGERLRVALRTSIGDVTGEIPAR